MFTYIVGHDGNKYTKPKDEMNFATFLGSLSKTTKTIFDRRNSLQDRSLKERSIIRENPIEFIKDDKVSDYKARIGAWAETVKVEKNFLGKNIGNGLEYLETLEGRMEAHVSNFRNTPESSGTRKSADLYKEMLPKIKELRQALGERKEMKAGIEGRGFC